MKKSRSLRNRIFPSLLVSLFVAIPLQAQTLPYRDTRAPLETRVQDLFNRLTPDEKMGMLTGTGFATQPIARLGVPPMEMADAGQGVRGGAGGTQGPATAFPSGVAMASSWDTDLIRRVGAAIGIEVLNKGTGAQVLLGPAVNIQRSPLGGRNGEYFSEDPFLAARLGVAYIKGMQGVGAVACIKHYAANNEEVDRDYVNVRVSERALREIYLPAFEAGVKEGGVWTIMSSYNRVNGPHATANEYLLTEVLKKGWNFDGLVMSDWGAVHETSGVIRAGNDLEMPGGGYLTRAKVADALARKTITQAQIDDSVRRILRTVLRAGLLDSTHVPNHALVNSRSHRVLAQEAASKGIVLLKNANTVLPLDQTTIRSVAVIGKSATGIQMGAAGSPGVQPLHSVQPLEGIKARAPNIAVSYAWGNESGLPVPASALTSEGAPGLKAEYFANKNLEGAPAVTRVDSQIQFAWNTPPSAAVPQTNFSVRWSGKLQVPTTGRYVLALIADDGVRAFVDGKNVINHWQDSAAAPQTTALDLVANRAYDFRVEYYQGTGEASIRLNWLPPSTPRFADAIAIARKSDVAVVFVSTQGTEGEGQDRPSMSLPNDQDALIEAVAKANPRTIVVLNNGTPVTMPWLARVPALIETWFPGQEGGAALAAVLFGDINPSGKLPTTLGARREDYPDTGHFPGVKGQVDYAEGIYVGYRHFDKKQIAPLFPFGHGLSYTTFRYGAARMSTQATGAMTASCEITNTGKRLGAEVVQLYISDPNPKIDKPLRELKGFARVELKPGESKTVTFPITPRDLSYCDVEGKQWRADAGEYRVEIGASSRDIRARASLRLARDWREPIPFLDPQTAGPKTGDLAAGKLASASSTQTDDTNTLDLTAKNAVDGDPSTRWSSLRLDPQWIAVDLGAPTIINRVDLQWEAAYAKAFAIQTSLDGKTWTNVYSTRDGSGDAQSITFAPISARHVRVLGTKRATEYGYSLFSFEVYAPKKGG